MSEVELNLGKHKKILGMRLFNQVLCHKGRTFGRTLYRIEDEEIVINETRPFELDAQDIVNDCTNRKKTINGSRFKKDAVMAVTEALMAFYINRTNKISGWRLPNPNKQTMFARKLNAPLNERLSAFKRKLELDYAELIRYGSYTSVEHNFNLTLMKGSELVVGNRVEETYPYSGKWKNSSKNVHNTDIKVSRSTLDNVINLKKTIHDPFNRFFARERALNIDGMATLEMTELNLAEHKVEDSGVRAFKAKWLEKVGRAEFYLVEGFIAVINSNYDNANWREREATIYHSEKSLKGALSGLLRKRKKQTLTENEISLIGVKKKAKHIKSLVSTLGNELVYVSDSDEVGNCESGRRNWMASVDIHPSTTKITFKELLEAYQKHPVKEAWSVVLHVERRLKQSAKKEA